MCRPSCLKTQHIVENSCLEKLPGRSACLLGAQIDTNSRACLGWRWGGGACLRDIRNCFSAFFHCCEETPILPDSKSGFLHAGLHPPQSPAPTFLSALGFCWQGLQLLLVVFRLCTGGTPSSTGGESPLDLMLGFIPWVSSSQLCNVRPGL